MLKALASNWKLGTSLIPRALAPINAVPMLPCKVLLPNTLSKFPFSTSHALLKHASSDQEEKPSHWMEYNDKIYPPQGPSEERRPAFVCHELKQIKYSPKKMWVVAVLVRGMSVDEALKQLSCVRRKGAAYVTRAIKEAVEMAIRDHNVEYKSNLWIAESFAVRGGILKGVRRCARGRITKIRYRYCNYYIRLEEGTPPEDYYCKNHQLSGSWMFDKWMKEIRGRKVTNSL